MDVGMQQIRRYHRAHLEAPVVGEMQTFGGGGNQGIVGSVICLARLLHSCYSAAEGASSRLHPRNQKQIGTDGWRTFKIGASRASCGGATAVPHISSV